MAHARRLFTTIFTLFGVLSPGLSAQYLGMEVGLVAPTGDFHNDGTGAGYKTGFVGSAFLEVKPKTSRVGLRVDVRYSDNSANAQLVHALGGIEPTGSHVKIAGGSADVVYAFPGSAKGPVVYLIGGGGAYHVTASVTEGNVFTADTSVTRFGWDLGGGMILGTGESVPFAEARYFDLPAFNSLHTSHICLTVGFRLNTGNP